MKFSISWLNEIFNIKLSSSELLDGLTAYGLEVDAVLPYNLACENVIVAKIQSTKPHPNADKLCITQVFDGENTFQVVCGAKNCRKDLITAFAPIGAVLFDKESKAHKIKKGKLRDEESFGMLLSAEELGLSDMSDGIIELDEHFEVGKDINEYFKDEVLEISFTPNLGHAMSMLGVSREISCLIERPFTLKELKIQSKAAKKTSDHLKIHVEKDLQNFQHKEALCPRYGTRLIENVKVTPSPLWLKQRLEVCGIKSINNVVDATNYVLHEIGQPLHAFDYDLIEGKEIEVRIIGEKVNFEALDKKSYSTPSDALFICDKNKPIALAGIIGGANTQVSEKTTSVLLEAAHFSAQSIRKTSRKLGLYTEASKHFERGVDANLVEVALERASALIEQLAQGKACGPFIIDQYQFTPHKLNLRISFLNQYLGIELKLENIIQILARIDLVAIKLDSEHLQVLIPTYRQDISLEVDLIEEVARIYGLDNIEAKTLNHKQTLLEDCPNYTFENLVHEQLLKLNLNEVISCDLISPEQDELQKEHKKSIRTLNFVSKEQSVLRTSLLMNHLQILKHNQDHQNFNYSLFEIGKTYQKNEDLFSEETFIGITLTGQSNPYHFKNKDEPFDFFHLKGVLENLFESFHIQDITYEKSSSKLYHPHKQAKILYQKKEFGILGQIHPSLQHKLGLKQKVFFSELSLASLINIYQPVKEIKQLCSFPSSERDWTFTALEDLEVGSVLDLLKNTDSRLLKKVTLRDIFRSDKIGSSHKNVTLRFVYRNDKKTLSFEATEMEHARIIDSISQKMKNLIIQTT